MKIPESIVKLDLRTEQAKAEDNPYEVTWDWPKPPPVFDPPKR